MNGNSTSVLEIEKLLWATIEHKGISNPEVEDLYRKARSRYEKMIIDHPDIYQTADQVEYSLWKLHYKHIDEYRKKISTSPSHVQGLKLFLSQVVEFYKNLIENFKIKRISEEADHYVCHRFLVCLGDLSRYMELCKKPPDVQKWGVAATYYLEATMVWPYSGNPQNQLALLATYIGDDFLALYHCIRSLAVKDPFPDATDNIMLLFHKNKSQSDLKRNKLGGGSDYLWPLFVRMISFFLVKPSSSSSSCFEDLPHTFAATMKELESLLALSDIELNSSLEPYKPFDSSRKGPYRAIQAVTILIFVIHNLTKAPKDEEISTWAWTCTFSFMGRIIQRCSSSSCSLLPAVLVFLEWYVDYAEETYGKDVDKVLNAKSYFFAALGDLLSGFDLKEHEMITQTALWEDHELRGFEPISQSYDFSTENKSHFEDGKSIRITRILLASTKIAERLKDSSQNPTLYDQIARKLYAGNREIEEEEEEEEVILFKPLTRYNSEPIQTSNDGQTEEGLRRSSSLFTAHNIDSSKSAGPPSLSGWVLNRESEKQELAPISEVMSMSSSLADMSISYVAPIPSAPLLPEEHGAAPVRPLEFVRPPPVFGLTSSEWLYRYNNNLSLEPNWGYDLIDKWGNRMVYLENPYPREKMLFGYQSPNINREPLQEMEWQLQTDYPFRIRGHPYPYMGS